MRRGIENDHITNVLPSTVFLAECQGRHLDVGELVHIG